MRRFFHLPSLLLFLVLGATTAHAAEFRLGWQPQQTLTYDVRINVNATQGGTNTQMTTEQQMTLRVQEIGDADTVRLAEGEDGVEYLRVSLDYGPMVLKIDSPVIKLEFNIRARETEVALNDKAVTDEDLTEPMVPLQQLIASEIELVIDRSGRVHQVSGLDKIDPTVARRMMATLNDFLMLPQGPLPDGSFRVSRRVTAVLPEDAAREAPEIELTGRVTGQEGDVATLEMPFARTLEDFGDDKSVRAIFDLTYVTRFDTKRGVALAETGEGTVELIPQKDDALGPIKLDLDMAVTLQREGEE
jgi:hypothetical protein